MKSKYTRVCIRLVATIGLFMHPINATSTYAIAGQVAAATAQAAQQPSLKIVIIGGEEPLKNLKQRVPREVIVEVHDQNERPVGAGAVVSFALQSKGGGTISGTAVTGANGRAVLSVSTDAVGSNSMSVAATLGTQTGVITVPVNVAAALLPTVAVVAASSAVAAGGAVAQATVATKDCHGLFDTSNVALVNQVCAGAVSPNTSPQCMSAVQKSLTQFSQLCTCVGGISVPQVYAQYGLTASDIDQISSDAKTVGFLLPPSCTSPSAPTTIQSGTPVFRPPE